MMPSRLTLGTAMPMEALRACEAPSCGGECQDPPFFARHIAVRPACIPVYFMSELSALSAPAAQ